mmetsp:Transcript_40926/g.108181  ORF Transcript_40926/g.108181 Transcript_40926/m.108181 type:complete len:127 (+) Transcript_40926:253-633(+)
MVSELKAMLRVVLSSCASLGKRQRDRAQGVLHQLPYCGCSLVWAPSDATIAHLEGITRMVRQWNFRGTIGAYRQAAHKGAGGPESLVLPAIMWHVPPGERVLNTREQAGQKAWHMLSQETREAIQY